MYLPKIQQILDDFKDKLKVISEIGNGPAKNRPEVGETEKVCE